MSTENAAPVKPWLTTAEAARILGKCPQTLWRWVQLQAIPKQFLFQVGARTYIARAWVVGGAA